MRRSNCQRQRKRQLFEATFLSFLSAGIYRAASYTAYSTARSKARPNNVSIEVWQISGEASQNAPRTRLTLGKVGVVPTRSASLHLTLLNPVSSPPSTARCCHCCSDGSGEPVSESRAKRDGAENAHVLKRMHGREFPRPFHWDGWKAGHNQGAKANRGVASSHHSGQQTVSASDSTATSERWSFTTR